LKKFRIKPQSRRKVGEDNEDERDEKESGKERGQRSGLRKAGSKRQA